MSSKDTGIFGEKIAEKFLKEKGYRILGKNYAPRFVSGPLRAEIDIIAKKDGVIVFVEVKSAVYGGFPVSPEEKVNFAKQRKIMKAAESWFMENKISFETKWQIDIIAITISYGGLSSVSSQNQKAKIQHFPNCV